MSVFSNAEVVEGASSEPKHQRYHSEPFSLIEVDELLENEWGIM